MKRVMSFPESMHTAFTIPLIDEGTFNEALREHYCAAFEEIYGVDVTDLTLFKLNFVHAYLLTYANFRNNSSLSVELLADIFASHYYNLGINNTDTGIIDEWESWHVPSEGGGYRDGVPSVFSEGECFDTLEGTNCEDEIYILQIVMSLASSVSQQLACGGSIPTYFDTAIGYQFGDTITLSGGSCMTLVVTLDDNSNVGGLVTVTNEHLMARGMFEDVSKRSCFNPVLPKINLLGS
jgi:hypothetical protein